MSYRKYVAKHEEESLEFWHKCQLALAGYADGDSPTDSFAAVTSRFAVAPAGSGRGSHRVLIPSLRCRGTWFQNPLASQLV